MEHQELFSGLIRLHLLRHAAEGKLSGRRMIDDRSARRPYPPTPLGQEVLQLATGKVREPFSEVIADAVRKGCADEP